MATDSPRSRRAARDVTNPGSPTVMPGDGDFRRQVSGNYTVDMGDDGGGGDVPDVTLPLRKLYIASDLFDEIRDMLDDPYGDFATDAYLCRKLNLAQDLLLKEVLSVPQLGALKGFVEVINVPAGTRSLAGLMTAGGPLALLDEIITMKERTTLSSRNSYDYVLMDPANDFPHTYALSPTNYNSLNGVYIHTGDDILLPGSSSVEDFEIFGKFATQRIENGDSPIPFGCEGILKFRAAELAAVSRGMMTMAGAYHEYAETAQSAHVAKSVMAAQRTPVRMRSFRSRRR